MLRDKLTNKQIVYNSENDALYKKHDNTVLDDVCVKNNCLYIVKTHWDVLEYEFITEIISFDKTGQEKIRHSYKSDYSYGNYVRIEEFDAETCKKLL